jgi:hypothetical protein
MQKSGKIYVRGGSNNPFVRFRRVRCPEELVAVSGSTPLDDDLYPALDLDAFALGADAPVPPDAPAPPDAPGPPDAPAPPHMPAPPDAPAPPGSDGDEDDAHVCGTCPNGFDVS